MQVPREISYEDLQKLMLKEMCQIVAERVLENSQGPEIFRARIAEAHRPRDPAYLQPEVPTYDKIICLNYTHFHTIDHLLHTI